MTHFGIVLSHDLCFYVWLVYTSLLGLIANTSHEFQSDTQTNKLSLKPQPMSTTCELYWGNVETFLGKTVYIGTNGAL